MKAKAVCTPVLIGAMAMAMSACATSAADNAPAALKTAASNPAKPLPRAARIAEKLARAEAAFDAGDTQLLGQLVASLNANGVKPFSDTQPDTLAQWQSASGASATPFRGRLLGPAYVRGELNPGETWRSAQTFKSGEASTLSVSHKGSGPVRMTVSDAKARAVCNPSPSMEPPCRFTPMFTQRYDIELKNEGTKRAVYFLVFD